MQGAAPSSKAANRTQTSSERGSFAYIKAWPEGSPSCSVHTGRAGSLPGTETAAAILVRPAPSPAKGRHFVFFRLRPDAPLLPDSSHQVPCLCSSSVSIQIFSLLFLFLLGGGGWFLFQQVPYLCFSSALLQPVGAIFLFYLCCASENMSPGRELQQASGSLILVAVAQETPLGHLALDARGAGGPLGPMGL